MSVDWRLADVRQTLQLSWGSQEEMHDQEVDENERDESQGKVPGHDGVDNDSTNAG